MQHLRGCGVFLGDPELKFFLQVGNDKSASPHLPNLGRLDLGLESGFWLRCGVGADLSQYLSNFCTQLSPT